MAALEVVEDLVLVVVELVVELVVVPVLVVEVDDIVPVAPFAPVVPVVPVSPVGDTKHKTKSAKDWEPERKGMSTYLYHMQPLGVPGPE
jgi:hypothetical protein